MRILDITLDRAAKRSGPIRPVLTGHIDHPIHHIWSQRDLEAAIHQVLIELVDEHHRNPTEILVDECIEHDDFVDTIHKLGMALTLRGISCAADGWNPRDAFFWIKRAPMFEVMMMIVFLKLTRFPSPSVR